MKRREFLTKCVVAASAITATAAHCQAHTIRTKETYKFTFEHQDTINEPEVISLVKAELKCNDSEAKAIQMVLQDLGSWWHKRPEDWKINKELYGAWEK